MVVMICKVRLICDSCAVAYREFCWNPPVGGGSCIHISHCEWYEVHPYRRQYFNKTFQEKHSLTPCVGSTGNVADFTPTNLILLMCYRLYWEIF